MVCMAPQSRSPPTTFPVTTLPTVRSSLATLAPCNSLAMPSTLRSQTLYTLYKVTYPCAWYAFPPHTCMADCLTPLWPFLNIENFPNHPIEIRNPQLSQPFPPNTAEFFSTVPVTTYPATELLGVLSSHTGRSVPWGQGLSLVPCYIPSGCNNVGPE